MNYYGMRDYQNVSLNKNPKIGCVYVLKFENSVKIGRTAQIKERIPQYKQKPKNMFYTDNFDVYCEVEKKLLDIFKKFKIKGEWFNADFNSVVNELKNTTKGYKKINKSPVPINKLVEYFDKNPNVFKIHVAESLGISKQMLSYWLKQKGEKFTVELTEKIKKLK